MRPRKRIAGSEHLLSNWRQGPDFVPKAGKTAEKLKANNRRAALIRRKRADIKDSQTGTRPGLRMRTVAQIRHAFVVSEPRRFLKT